MTGILNGLPVEGGSINIFISQFVSCVHESAHFETFDFSVKRFAIIAHNSLFVRKHNYNKLRKDETKLGITLSLFDWNREHERFVCAIC